MNQSSFEFGAPQPVEPTPKKPRAKRATPSPAICIEQMAAQVERHADYKILRRLVPITDFGATPATASTQHIQRILVLDTETTGLSHQADKIIELAMLLVDVDTATGLPTGPVTLFEGFEYPGMPIPAVAKKITGITDDMVQGQRLDDQAVAALVAQADLVIAHNAGFDRPFVEARFPSFATQSWACSFKDIDWKAAGADSAKLSALAADHGWFYDAHRALVDCHALLQVLTQSREGTTTNGLQKLLAAASAPSFKLHATGSPFESKDKLKARGYRWDADAKVWYCLLPSQDKLDTELVWLRAEVYGRRNAHLEMEVIDSTVRFSNRFGLVETIGLPD